MAAAIRVVKNLNLGALAVALVLALVQPWLSAHLYVPLQSPNFLTIGNQYAAWSLRIGHVGGVDGFDAGFTQTNPYQFSYRQKHKPFPLTWIVDWEFQIRGSSPYALIFTPLYFPALALGTWPLLSVTDRLLRSGGSARPPSVDGSPYTPPTSTEGGEQ